ncbi:hypothetical protein KR038_004890 [Drosophila bunnanda]|nr:hypothetical protein KR038_004890 [Drosophila bunnanda]
MPFNFDTLHLPCELDIPYNHIARMPVHCMWLINNRFQSQSFYRNYMLMRAESFFFGQYYERLRRYELIPHAFAFD